jgi:Zn-dependent peptidase ImmA (M78 family)
MVRQAQHLAKFYHRPFGLFFLPQPPTILPLSADYRRLPGVHPGVESPELRLALRTMLQRREITLELREELGIPIEQFNVVAHLSESPTVVGKRLRETLGITSDEQLKWSTDWEAWRRWREALDASGVLTFQFPKVGLDQTRGVSLFRFPLPAIGINSKESSPAARSFSLLHELVHISLSLGKEEQAAIGETRDDTAWQSVERFAEKAASEALIPTEILTILLNKMKVSQNDWTVQLMRTLATKFRVTPLALATRLRAMDAMSWDSYKRWKEEWYAYLGTLQRKKGFASVIDKTIGRSGRPFVQLVIEALDTNRITAVQASRYLDLRFDHFDALRKTLRIRSGHKTGDYDDGE